VDSERRNRYSVLSGFMLAMAACGGGNGGSDGSVGSPDGGGTDATQIPGDAETAIGAHRPGPCTCSADDGSITECTVTYDTAGQPLVTSVQWSPNFRRVITRSYAGDQLDGMTVSFSGSWTREDTWTFGAQVVMESSGEPSTEVYDPVGLVFNRHALDPENGPYAPDALVQRERILNGNPATIDFAYTGDPPRQGTRTRTSTTTPGGIIGESTAVFMYDDQGRLISHDEWGEAYDLDFSYEYEGDLFVRIRSLDADVGEELTTYVYDAYDNLIRKINPDGVVVHYNYDCW
jgi:YD repeat-containing protein